MVNHGTHRGYDSGCRCDKCRAVKRLWVAAKRADWHKLGLTSSGKRRVQPAPAVCEGRGGLPAWLR
jgi:hypothetical protein